MKDSFEWEKILIYTPSGFIFEITDDDYLRYRTDMLSDIVSDKMVYDDSASYEKASEVIRKSTWTELSKYITFVDFLETSSSDILQESMIKRVPELDKEKHRTSIVDKRKKFKDKNRESHRKRSICLAGLF
jgi:hypothetical protein